MKYVVELRTMYQKQINAGFFRSHLKNTFLIHGFPIQLPFINVQILIIKIRPEFFNYFEMISECFRKLQRRKKIDSA
ncbi:MAG: hypothetical protein GY714_22970 [Desulfobacterales bacterium]|nr:hypothetical protein [Desulfobacterales bacterium]